MTSVRGHAFLPVLCMTCGEPLGQHQEKVEACRGDAKRLRALVEDIERHEGIPLPYCCRATLTAFPVAPQPTEAHT